MAMPALLMSTSSVSTAPAARWICEPFVTSNVSGVTRLSAFPHNLLRSPSKCFVDKRLADTAVGTRNQNGLVFNIHRLLLSGRLLLLRLWGPGGYGVKDYLKCREGIGWRSRDTARVDESTRISARIRRGFAAVLGDSQVIGSLSRRRGNMSELEGTKAVVVGASRGFGRGIVEALVEAGAEVHALSRGNASEVVRATGGRAHAIRADAAHPETASRILREIESTVVVLNAV